MVHTLALIGAWRLCYSRLVSFLMRCVAGLVFLLVACTPADQTKAPSKPLRADISSAGPGSVQALVAQAQQEARAEGRRLVVYVGASWCEPCQVFLNTLKAGELPAHFADLRFLKFDHDNDENRLDEAGYGGAMIPRFVVPAPDGSSTGRRFEGSTKGPEAIANIVPRLEGILNAPEAAAP